MVEVSNLTALLATASPQEGELYLVSDMDELYVVKTKENIVGKCVGFSANGLAFEYQGRLTVTSNELKRSFLDHHNQTRSYAKGHACLRDSRLLKALVDIPKDTVFDEAHWEILSGRPFIVPNYYAGVKTIVVEMSARDMAADRVGIGGLILKDFDGNVINPLLEAVSVHASHPAESLDLNAANVVSFEQVTGVSKKGYVVDLSVTPGWGSRTVRLSFVFQNALDIQNIYIKPCGQGQLGTQADSYRVMASGVDLGQSGIIPVLGAPILRTLGFFNDLTGVTEDTVLEVSKTEPSLAPLPRYKPVLKDIGTYFNLPQDVVVVPQSFDKDMDNFNDAAFGTGHLPLPYGKKISHVIWFGRGSNDLGMKTVLGIMDNERVRAAPGAETAAETKSYNVTLKDGYLAPPPSDQTGPIAYLADFTAQNFTVPLESELTNSSTGFIVSAQTTDGSKFYDMDTVTLGDGSIKAVGYPGAVDGYRAGKANFKFNAEVRLSISRNTETPAIFVFYEE